MELKPNQNQRKHQASAVSYQGWLKLIGGLTPFECLCLTGLLARNSQLQAEDLSRARLQQSDVCRFAEVWAAKHFRKALNAYSMLAGTAVAGTIGSEKVAASLGLPPAGWLAFTAWAKQSQIDAWAKRYRQTFYEGEGGYAITRHAEPTPGKFRFTVAPAINKLITTASDKTRFERAITIAMPESCHGLFEAERPLKVDYVVASDPALLGQHFAFNAGKHRVKGEVVRVEAHHTHPKTLVFTATGVDVTPI